MRRSDSVWQSINTDDFLRAAQAASYKTTQPRSDIPVHLDCEVVIESTSCLPKLAPPETVWSRNIRNFKKLFLISDNHYQGKLEFKSRNLLMQERTRHLTTSYWYIIHPYSKIAIILEIFMTIYWPILLMEDSFQFFFLSLEESGSSWYYEIVSVLYLGIHFLKGFKCECKNVIVLEPRGIIVRYITTYMIPDLVGLLPALKICKHWMPFGRPPQLLPLIKMTKQVRAVRWMSVIQYSKHITVLLGLGTNFHWMIQLLIGFFCLLHYASCVLYQVSTIYVKYNVKEHVRYSWTHQLNLTETSSLTEKYVTSLHLTLAVLVGAGYADIKLIKLADQIVITLINVAGLFYVLFCTAVVLGRFSNTFSSDNKYATLVQSVKHFALKNKVPRLLQSKILLYYNEKYHNSFFDDDLIMSDMSEHLRYEIILHSSQHLFRTMPFLKDMPKSILGALIASVKSELYLANDVVLTKETLETDLFFVAYGMLAIYRVTGNEIMHIEDGDHMGMIKIFFPEYYEYTIVATETTELYRLPYKDFKQLYVRSKEFSRKVNVAVHEQLAALGRNDTEANWFNTTESLMEDLRHQLIIEQKWKRQRTDL